MPLDAVALCGHIQRRRRCCPISDRTARYHAPAKQALDTVPADAFRLVDAAIVLFYNFNITPPTAGVHRWSWRVHAAVLPIPLPLCTRTRALKSGRAIRHLIHPSTIVPVD